MQHIGEVFPIYIIILLLIFV